MGSLSGLALCCSLAVAAAEPMRGMCYSPVPKRVWDAPPPYVNDDLFADNPNGPESGGLAQDSVEIWGKRNGVGRDDLATMEKMGVNHVRLYGNDPRMNHKTFLDLAHQRGMKVIPGTSDYPFTQDQNHKCGREDNEGGQWNCYKQLKEAFGMMLRNGFAQDGKYHDALDHYVLINEPDYKAPGLSDPVAFTRTVVSAFDGALQAEKEAGITENLIKFTAAYSFGICGAKCGEWGSKPGLGQLHMLKLAMLDPSTVNYTATNDLAAAFEDRWHNSINTPSPARTMKPEFIEPYLNNPDAFGNKPFFFAEYHYKVDGTEQTQADVTEILALTSDIFLGINFFQFQQALWKAPHEDEFGIFGLGNEKVGTSKANGDTWDVYCLTNSSYPGKKNLAVSIATAYHAFAATTTVSSATAVTVSGATTATAAAVTTTTEVTTTAEETDAAASNSLAWSAFLIALATGIHRSGFA